MPLLDYKCTHCIHTEEKLVKSRDFDKLMLCPKCGNFMNRQVSNIANFTIEASKIYV